MEYQYHSTLMHEFVYLKYLLPGLQNIYQVGNMAMSGYIIINSWYNPDACLQYLSIAVHVLLDLMVEYQVLYKAT